MNLHSDILAQAAFLPRPGSYIELRDMVGLIEERVAVLTERERSYKVQLVLRWWKRVIYLIISRVELLVRTNNPVRMDPHVGVVENKYMFRGIVRGEIPPVP